MTGNQVDSTQDASRDQMEQTQRRLSADLQRHDRMFDTVMASVQDFVYLFDLSGRFTFANKALLDLWQKPLDQAVGRNFHDLEYPHALATRLQRQIEEVIASRRPLKDETPYTSAFGTRQYEYIFVPLFAADGTVEAVAGVTRDITERKAAEAEMARAYAAEQTAHAQAEAALRVRDQFLSVASHELRTPLTSLMGYAEMLSGASSQDTATTQKIAARIARQARRLNALIEQLLDVSRLQQGQFVLERRLVDVAALAEHVVDDFRSTLPAGAGHTLALIRPDEPLLLVGDSNRLEEVLLNLLSNAVKYSPQGGPIQLRITSAATETILEVADQGIGVPAQAQARLFEPFYRAPNAGTRAGGFGLGLYIVGQIVQRHGWRIEVTSTENVGSTFRVVIVKEHTEY